MFNVKAEKSMKISKYNINFIMIKSLTIILCWTGLFLNTANANDLKTYPAFMCLENGKETGDFNRSMYRITRVNNSGTGILLCPIIRDSVDSNDAYDNVFVLVNTYRTQSALPIRLTLRKFSARGELMKEVTKFPADGHQETHLKIKFKKDYGYYMLEVAMGVNRRKEYAKVFSYMVVE